MIRKNSFFLDQNKWFSGKRLAILVGVAIFLLYSFRIWFPNKMCFDEVWHVKCVREMCAGRYMVIRHPVLWYMVSSAAMLFFGDYSTIWRLYPLICGIGIIFCVYFLAEKITGDKIVAFLAAFLITFDFFTIVLSRIAMLNTPMLFFMLLSILFFLRHKPARRRTRARIFFFSGLFFGLAMTTRWFSVWTGFFIAFYILREIVRSRPKIRPALIKDAIVYFVCLPLLIYFSFHLVIPFLKGMTVADMWKVQVSDLNYHRKLISTHAYGSAWFSWPYLARPVWFLFSRDKGSIFAKMCIGNPAVYWMTPVAIIFLVWLVLRKRSRPGAFVLTGLLMHWLPYAVIGRVTYLHYFHTASPFIVIGLGMFLARLWYFRKWGRVLVVGYLATVMALFIFWYPLLTAWPVSRIFYQSHIWFRTWT